MKDQAADG